MIESLLIANRGEIACRIIRTARAMGIRTIAVYSDADAKARHVQLADTALRLGPTPPRESYLSISRLLGAAREAGATAIHPGYGFLSENAEFAQACVDAGLIFVGPPAAVIASMGSKSAAKEAMRESGVPVLPGYHGEEQSLAQLKSRALTLGFPLIVKPSGGGGGKGMQIVARAEELREALEGARRIAERSFADPTLLLERYLASPRHVEVQILADQHGRILHLHDRDCSIQRRHQKLIEEAPAPDIADPVRARLHAAAITVARRIGYVNAGTVEFLYSDGEFYFMEMNTRLQVEHPVTEAITGLDLVEWQLRIAAGERLAFSQEQIGAVGVAVEARVCAEDPSADFAPSAGRPSRLSWPSETDGVRVDAGFNAGDEIPADYDSLLAKVIASASDRPAALARLAWAVDQIRVTGIRTNANWLARALRSKSLRAGPVSTRFVVDEAKALADPSLDAAQRAEAAAITAVAVAVAGRAVREPQCSPWQVGDSFRIGLPCVRSERLRIGDTDLITRLRALDNHGGFEVAVDGQSWQPRWRPIAPGIALVEINARERHVEYQRHDDAEHVWIDGTYWVFELPDEAQGAGTPAPVAGELIARLPGTVARVLVGVGDTVAQGQPLMVVEAMKMEHTIRAPHAGRVERMCFAAGERVVEGARLVEITSSD